jgi:beta-phosphoglucomutase-like phosphatase (HAD superfamily)
MKPHREDDRAVGVRAGVAAGMALFGFAPIPHDRGAGGWFSRSRIRWSGPLAPVRLGDHPAIRILLKKLRKQK